jgi:recombination protein RecA
MARESGKVASQAALKLVGKDDGDKQRALEAAIAQIAPSAKAR